MEKSESLKTLPIVNFTRPKMGQITRVRVDSIDESNESIRTYTVDFPEDHLVIIYNKDLVSRTQAVSSIAHVGAFLIISITREDLSTNLYFASYKQVSIASTKAYEVMCNHLHQSYKILTKKLEDCPSLWPILNDEGREEWLEKLIDFYEPLKPTEYHFEKAALLPESYPILRIYKSMNELIKWAKLDTTSPPLLSSVLKTYPNPPTLTTIECPVTFISFLPQGKEIIEAITKREYEIPIEPDSLPFIFPEILPSTKIKLKPEIQPRPLYIFQITAISEKHAKHAWKHFLKTIIKPQFKLPEGMCAY